jgi:hypothetical protein
MKNLFGWEIECKSPLEIRHEDGSFATGQAAQIILNSMDDAEDDVASKVKIFMGYGTGAENAYNTWMEENKRKITVIDIKFSCSATDAYIAVFYKEEF